MGFLDAWLAPKSKDREQSVHVFIKLSGEMEGDNDDAIYALEEELSRLIEGWKVGDFDGDEWGGGYCQLFMYGPNADTLFDTIAPVLMARTEIPFSYAVKRYGPPGSNEQVVRLKAI